MKIVKPITITAAQYPIYPAPLGYSNEGDYAEWNVATPYVTGNRVIVDSLKSQFEAVAGSTGTAPTLTMTTPWLRVGASNAWRLFDGVLSVPFVGQAAPIAGYNNYSRYFVLTEILGRFDTVAILETNATSCLLQVEDQNLAPIYFELKLANDNSQVDDYWGYFFSDILKSRFFVFDDVPGWGTASPGSKITILLSTSGSGGNVPLEVGEIVIGKSVVIGETKADPTKRLVDFSRKEADQFGNITIVQRSYSYEASFDVMVAPARKGLVDNTIAHLRATPCLFYPSEVEANKGVVIFGLINEFEITYSTPDVVHATLSVQGLT